MENANTRGSIRNVVEVMWEDLGGHFGGAYSKFLVRPETAGSKRIDYGSRPISPRLM
jgi:hypothetical protein